MTNLIKYFDASLFHPKSINQSDCCNLVIGINKCKKKQLNAQKKIVGKLEKHLLN